MAKRKRNADVQPREPAESPRKILKSAKPTTSSTPTEDTATIQIVTGSYERVLHGFTATVPLALEKEKGASDVAKFADTFLFHGHASAIRCLAISPLPGPDDAKQRNVVLATGGTDDKVNLYNLSIIPSEADDSVAVPTLAGNKILENPRNTELGSLLHHSASITALHFPTQSKLLSAAEDNTISIVRTRDWTPISSIKAPLPKMQGRPSGDTSLAGPSGVNDFAVHPSMKLMLSVGKGEKCMRLWNLVTGKKAGILNFGRDVLTAAKEGKWSSGEGRKIIWDSSGSEFAVSFERGVVVFGIDSRPKCKLVIPSNTKVHHSAYVQVKKGEDPESQLLAVSTEDGRILFYSTATDKLVEPETEGHGAFAIAPLCYQLGGKTHGQSTRIKEFEILTLTESTEKPALMVITSSSDGDVKFWSLHTQELSQAEATEPVQVGSLVGSYPTGNRITCMKAFVMRKPGTSELDDEYTPSDDAQSSAAEISESSSEDE